MKLNFDFTATVGEMKPMHGVGQPPIFGINTSLFHFLGEAGIPYSRLHDVGGLYGGNMFVDIHNVFRDFDADENDEESYDFAFTDILIAELVKNGIEPIYRLGETIENYNYVKAYRIFPPKDYLKWAKICEHVILHYNYGWANGFHYGIKYWEIWNEPDNGRDNLENMMWQGTPEQYYELYDVTAKHLKSVFGDEIRVGGYASCGFRYVVSNPRAFGIDAESAGDEFGDGRSKSFLDFFEGFFKYISEHKTPLDFFSWHSYLSVKSTLIAAKYLEKRLGELGYGDVELQLNEWNNGYEDMADADAALRNTIRLRGTGLAAAKALGMMCAMHDTKNRLLCFYDAGFGTSYYRGMFDPKTREPEPLYYAFLAFDTLYQLKTRVKCEGACREIYALAAANGEKRAAVIANAEDGDAELLTNLPEELSAYIIDDTRRLSKIEINNSKFIIPSGSILLFTEE